MIDQASRDFLRQRQLFTDLGSKMPPPMQPATTAPAPQPAESGLEDSLQGLGDATHSQSFLNILTLQTLQEIADTLLQISSKLDSLSIDKKSKKMDNKEGEKASLPNEP